MIVKHTFPSNEDFNKLFVSVGWTKREDYKIDSHRTRSVYCVSVYDENDLICGMGRVVGDGAYYTIYDVVVRSDCQRKGIGSHIMHDIINWYNAIRDDDTYLYLGASKNKEKFYEKFGFRSRPFDNIGAGMIYVD